MSRLMSVLCLVVALGGCERAADAPVKAEVAPRDMGGAGAQDMSRDISEDISEDMSKDVLDAGGDEGGLGAFGVSGVGEGRGGVGREEALRRATVLPVPKGATVRVEEVEAQGALSEEVLARVARRSRVWLLQCYAAGLARQPELAGVLGIKVVVGVEGRVVSARREAEEGGITDEGLARCVLGEAYRWEFPRPTSGIVAARYTLRFER